MFAVPGWSVPADALKTQKPLESNKKTSSTRLDNQGSPNDKPKTRKRKRSQASVPAVTSENVADLWRKHIEGKASKRYDEGQLSQSNNRLKRRKSNDIDENGIKNTDEMRIHTATAFRSLLDDEDPKSIDLEDLNQKKKETVLQSTSKKMKPRNAESKAEGKSKYEQRKTLASTRREQTAKRLELSNNTSSCHPALSSERSKISVSKTTKPTPLSNVPKSNTSPIRHSSPSPPPPSKNLTPLQSQMREKLVSARFRHLNQTLYTTPSAQSLKVFTESPKSFTSYHAGFRAQIAVWPQNPVDTFIADLQARAAIKSPPSQKQRWRDERKGKKKPASAGPPLDPLPRSPPSNQCTIADLGCGDATLAGALTPLAAKTSLRLLSFDLATGDGPHVSLITVADLCNLPLRAGEVDIAILCLALMGTNWVEGVDEAARVIRLGGEVWVAEVRSRFPRLKGGGGIGTVKLDEEGEDAVLDEEKDNGDRGLNRTRDEDTDVSPFVGVFERRGFALRGTPDLANRMFVRMKFVKERDGGLVQGGDKGGTVDYRRDTGFKGQGKEARRTGMGKRKGKLVGDEEADEGKVLKPCVYKTR